MEESIITIEELRKRPEFGELIQHIENFDVDHDGKMDADEFLLMMQSAVRTNGKKRFLTKLFLCMACFAMALLFANFGLTFVALNMAKEIKVGSGALESKDGEVAKTGTLIEMEPFTWDGFLNKKPEEFLLMDVLEVSMSTADIRYEWCQVSIDSADNYVELISKEGLKMSVDLAAKKLTFVDLDGAPIFEYPDNTSGRRKLISPNAADQGQANSQSDD